MVDIIIPEVWDFWGLSICWALSLGGVLMSYGGYESRHKEYTLIASGVTRSTELFVLPS